MEFLLLGRMEARDRDGHPVPLGRRRERCLLGLLLLDAGRLVATDRLVDLLWEDDPPRHPRATLRTYASRLRQHLRAAADVGGPHLVARPGGYLVEVDPQRVDAHRFVLLVERARAENDPARRAALLAAGLALWRGPLLADVASPALRKQVGADLIGLRLSATELFVDCELERGRHQEVIGALSAIVAAHPLHEPLVGRLMLALYRAGRREDALIAYQKLRDRLAAELGTEPGRHLHAQYLAVLRRDPGLHHDPQRPAGHSPARPAGPLAARPADPGPVVVSAAIDTGEAGKNPSSSPPDPAARPPMFAILGPLRMYRDGQCIDLPGSMLIRRLLGVLLLAQGEPLPATRLAELAWTAPRSHGSVQVAVSRLRSWLHHHATTSAGAPLLSKAGPGYRLLVEPDEVDLGRFRDLVARASAAPPPERFELLHAAFRLRRGPVLADLSLGPDNPLVEAVSAVVRDAACRYAEAACTSGQPAAAVAHVADVAVAHPLDEPLQARFIRLLAAAGRPAEALTRYATLRSRLADELGADPSDEVREAYLAVLQRSPTAGPGRAVTTPPCLLPPRTTHLIGRNDELAALRRLLAAGRRGDASARGDERGTTVVNVFGIGGVGKTSLAVHAARRLLPEFPGGCLFADLSGTGDLPASPQEIVAGFLRALGLTDSEIPTDGDTRVGLYRSVLANRRVLVVLDDAFDEAQVRPLLPTADGCAVIVTSRRTLVDLPGAQPLQLGVLSARSAIDLLAEVSARDELLTDRAAARIVDLCGRLPLAVRIVGARLRTRADLTPSAMARRLARQHDRLDELVVGDLHVRRSIDIGYRRLDPEQRTLLRRIGLLPVAEFSGWIAADLLGCPPKRADRLLERLLEANLLDVVSAPGAPARYRIHDLVQLFLRERAMDEDQPDVRQAAIARAYHSLLALTLAADARLPSRMHLPPTPPLPWPRPSHDAVARLVGQDPVGWLETERRLLVAAVRHLAGQHQPELAARITSSLTNFFESRGYLDEWRQCLAAVQRADLPPEVATAIQLSHGQQLFHSGRHREAMACLRRARRGYHALADAHREAVAATALAVAARAVGLPRLAAAAFQRSLGLYRRIAARHPGAAVAQEAWAHLGLGNLRLEFDTDLAAARRHYARAVDLFRDAGDCRGEANTLGCLSAVDRREGRTAEAIANGRSAVALFQAIGDRVNLATAEASLAFDLVTAGQIGAARQLLDRADHTFRRLHHPWGTARVLRARGRLSLAEGNPGAAITMLRRTVEMFGALGQPIGVADALQDLARAHLEAGDQTSARDAADRADRLYAQFGNRDRDRIDARLRGLEPQVTGGPGDRHQSMD